MESPHPDQEAMYHLTDGKLDDELTDQDILDCAIGEVCDDCKGLACGRHLGTDCDAVKDTVKAIKEEL